MQNCVLTEKTLIYDSHEVQTSRTHYNFKKIYRIEKFMLNFTDHVIVENDTRADYHNDLYKECPTSLHNYSELYDINDVTPFPLRKQFNIPENKKLYCIKAVCRKAEVYLSFWMLLKM